MKVNKFKALTIEGVDENTKLIVKEDNRGEPYCRGLTIELYDGGSVVEVMLQEWELKMLVNTINKWIE